MSGRVAVEDAIDQLRAAGYHVEREATRLIVRESQDVCFTAFVRIYQGLTLNWVDERRIRVLINRRPH